MKRIKDLTIRVNYRMGLSDLEVADDIYNGLIKMADKISVSADEVDMAKDKDMQAAFEWLSYNINEDDSMSFEYEVEDLIDE